LGKRSRKRGSTLRPPQPPPPRKGPSRSEARNAAARGALVPLEEGERPLAVTIGAIVAALLAAGNLGAYLAGAEISGERPAIAGIVSYTALMLLAAWGMWKAKYWAVLGMEAILGILLVIFLVLLFTASNLVTVLISLAVILPAGALFWFLIKAMARIQMPERRPG
jgi:hypothetical protein